MSKEQNKSGFDIDLYLEIAKEMGIEVAEGPGPDEVNGKPVDVMEIIFGKTTKEKEQEKEQENEINQ